MEEAQRDERSLRMALAVYVLVFTGKFAVYLVTGVMAVLAEALHTLSDVFIAGLLLAAIIHGRKQSDEDHMFGHGRAQNVAGVIAATLFIGFTAYQLYVEAFSRLVSPEEATYQDLGPAVGVLVGSILIVAWPLVGVVHQRTRGPAVTAQLVNLVTDELGLVAALVATLFIIGGHPVADPIASIVVATIIAYNGIGLLRNNASFLLGRAPGREYLAELEEAALSVPGVVGVRDIRAEYVGPNEVLSGMHVQVPPDLVLVEAIRIADEVRQRVGKISDAGYCMVQVDAALPASAKGGDRRPILAC
jgi:cation diffusion facilitator family transporter